MNNAKYAQAVAKYKQLLATLKDMDKTMVAISCHPDITTDDMAEHAVHYAEVRASVFSTWQKLNSQPPRVGTMHDRGFVKRNPPLWL